MATSSTTHPNLWKSITIPLQTSKNLERPQRPIWSSLSSSSPLSRSLLLLRKRSSTASSLSIIHSSSLSSSSSSSSFSSLSFSSSSSFLSSSSPFSFLSSSDKTQDKVFLSGAFPRSRWMTTVAAASSSPALAITNLSQLPPLEQSLLFLGFFFCAITGTIVLLFILALPTLDALRRLTIMMEKLKDVIREELPGTVSSIKLSGREINDLTQELSNLRKRLQVKFPSGENRELDIGKGTKSPIMN